MSNIRAQHSSTLPASTLVRCWQFVEHREISWVSQTLRKEFQATLDIWGCAVQATPHFSSWHNKQLFGLESMNVRFDTTFEDHTLTPDRFIMVPRLGFCEQHLFVCQDSKQIPDQRRSCSRCPDRHAVMAFSNTNEFLLWFVCGRGGVHS